METSIQRGPRRARLRDGVRVQHARLRLAWFRARTLDCASPLDDIAALIAELQTSHDIEVFTAATAHDFVWKSFRAPYALCVFELDNTSAHAFLWPYLLHYGGILFLRALTLHDSRAQALIHEGRPNDYAAEFTFNEHYPPPQLGHLCRLPHGNWRMLRAPLMASRVSVVSHTGMADLLRQEYPDARIRYAPLGVRAVSPVPGVPRAPAVPGVRDSAAVTFGMLASDRVEAARRALARACDAGASATLLVDASPEHLLRDADVVVILQWPAARDPHALALAAMASGKPVVVLEHELTADWPVVDPHTWRPRGLAADAPIAVSIDVRDEEHSLATTIRRLSSDATLRTRLGSAAQAWWLEHATVPGAADAWQHILREAVALDPPPHPVGWPAHLTADGTERARDILREFGVTVDFL